MKLIKCKSCGSNELFEDGDFVVCSFCQSRYVPQAEDFPQSETHIDLASDVQILLDKCRSDPKNRVRYINLILDLDPDNDEVNEFF